MKKKINLENNRNQIEKKPLLFKMNRLYEEREEEEEKIYI